MSSIECIECPGDFNPNETFTSSVTRLGNLLNFVKPFKACGNNYFDQIAHILVNFGKVVEIVHFARVIILDNFYGHLAIFYWSHCHHIAPSVFLTNQNRFSPPTVKARSDLRNLLRKTQ